MIRNTKSQNIRTYKYSNSIIRIVAQLIRILKTKSSIASPEDKEMWDITSKDLNPIIETKHHKFYYIMRR